MGKFTRFSGTYDIVSIDTGDFVRWDGSGMTISGDLTILGTTTSVESTDTQITDNVILLNSGEVGAGVTLVTSGLEIDRGSEDNVQLRYNDSSEVWEFTNDGTTYNPIGSGGVGITRIKEDTTPELGGDLSTNGFIIQNKFDDGSSYVPADMILDPGANQSLQIDNGDIKIEEQAGDSTGVAGFTKLYAKTQAGGGTGLYIATTTNTGEELVSKSKAIVFGLIF